VFALPLPQWTYEEYLIYEASHPARHEYYHGVIYAMSGGTEDHVLITGNIHAGLHAQMRGTTCRVYASDMQVGFANEEACFYPDVAAVCGEREIQSYKGDRLLNPMVIVEVLSRSTENYDKKTKFETYQLIPSLTDYLLVRQDRVHVMHYWRQEDDWPSSIYRELTDEIDLPAIGCRLRLADIYEGITWSSDNPTNL
jgi:Uma2 family endonuclease